jgi:hypothetical protein
VFCWHYLIHDTILAATQGSKLVINCTVCTKKNPQELSLFKSSLRQRQSNSIPDSLSRRSWHGTEGFSGNDQRPHGPTRRIRSFTTRMTCELRTTFDLNIGLVLGKSLCMEYVYESFASTVATCRCSGRSSVQLTLVQQDKSEPTKQQRHQLSLDEASRLIR